MIEQNLEFGDRPMKMRNLRSDNNSFKTSSGHAPFENLQLEYDIYSVPKKKCALFHVEYFEN